MIEHSVNITFTRRELLARLAAIGNRVSAVDSSLASVKHIAQYVTECGVEFHLSNDEQVLFLKFIVSGIADADALFYGDIA